MCCTRLLVAVMTVLTKHVDSTTGFQCCVGHRGHRYIIRNPPWYQIKLQICTWVRWFPSCHHTYVVIDNIENVQRHEINEKMNNFDDCGVWDGTKGITTNTLYFITEANEVKTIALKGDRDRLCFSKKNWAKLNGCLLSLN